MFNAFSRALGPSHLRMGVLGGDLLGWLTAAQGVQLGHEVVMWDAAPGPTPGSTTGESDLDGALRESWQAKRLRFATTLASAVEDCLVVAITLPLEHRGDGTVELAPLEELARQLASCLVGHTLLVFRSAAPAGTAERFQAWVTEGLAPGATLGLAVCQEQVASGRALSEALYGDRLLIGVDHPWDAALVEALLAPLDRPVLITSIASVEALAAAPTLDHLEQLFFEDVVNLCDRAGIELREVWNSLIFVPHPHRPALEVAC